MLSTFAALYGTGFINWEKVKVKKVRVEKDIPGRCHDMNKTHTRPSIHLQGGEKRISRVMGMDLRSSHPMAPNF